MSDSLIYIIIYVLPSLPLDYMLNDSGTFPGSPWFPQCLCRAAYKISAYKHLSNQWMNNWMSEWASWPGGSAVEKNLDRGMKKLSPKFLFPTQEPLILQKPLYRLWASASSSIKWGQQNLHSVPHQVVSEVWMQNLLAKCKALPTVGCFCCAQRELASPAGMWRNCIVWLCGVFLFLSSSHWVFPEHC